MSNPEAPIPAPTEAPRPGSWDEAVTFVDALASRGIRLLLDGSDRFRAEPQGVMTAEDKARVGKLRPWLLCNAILDETTKRIAAAKNASPVGAVARAKQIAAEEEIDRATIAGNVEATRRAAQQLLDALGVA